jgi:hypothetical protein
MPEKGNPDLALDLVAFVIFNTIIVGGYLTIFKPGERGCFARRGSLGEWGICLFYSCTQAFLAVPHPSKIVSIVLWWVVAILVFQLTVRQALKLGIAHLLILLILWVAVATAAA